MFAERTFLFSDLKAVPIIEYWGGWLSLISVVNGGKWLI